MSNIGLLPSADQFLQLFAVLQDAEPVTVIEGTSYEEIEDALNKVKLLADDKEAIEKFLSLVDVLHQSLIPCLIATPFVYLSDEKWKLHSHPEFRAAKRKQLKKLEEEINAAAHAPPEYDTRERIKELVDEFESILIELFHVRIPAMPNMYITENYYDLIAVSEVCTSLCEKIESVKKYEVQSRLYHYTKVMLEWFFLCPVGRPVVYVSDEDWSTVSESSLRINYRAQLLK